MKSGKNVCLAVALAMTTAAAIYLITQQRDSPAFGDRSAQAVRLSAYARDAESMSKSLSSAWQLTVPPGEASAGASVLSKLSPIIRPWRSDSPVQGQIFELLLARNWDSLEKSTPVAWTGNLHANREWAYNTMCHDSSEGAWEVIIVFKDLGVEVFHEPLSPAQIERFFGKIPRGSAVLSGDHIILMK